MSIVLELRNMSAGYGPVQVIDHLDLQVRDGERLAVVGLNGHGKTTLLRALVGLTDWRRGKIDFRGHSIVERPTHDIARQGVVLVPQGDAIFPGLTVRDNLDAGAYGGGAWRSREERRRRVVELFPSLGERLDQLAGTLSGGERRMCSIGRGLMGNASVYLIDEPSLGLAPSLAKSIVNALLSQDLEGRTLVMAEQNRTLIDGRVDRVYRLHAGRLVDGDDAAASTSDRGAA